MRKISSDSVNRIQELLTSKKRRAEEQTPTKVGRKSKSPVASRSPLARSPHKGVHVPEYQPMEKDYHYIQQRVRSIHNEMQDQLNFKVQNKHSYYLNAKNPKPPLYMRALQLAKQKQMWLQQKRREKLKAQQQAEVLLEQQAMAALAQNGKILSKQQAYQLSERLYKEHYNKANRHNEMQLMKRHEEAMYYRNKPLISDVSKEIFKLYTEKNQLENDVFSRFQQYKETKQKRQEHYQQFYKDKYCPFSPMISQTSRMLLTNKKSSRDLTRSKHCISCSEIKRDKSVKKIHSDKKPLLRKTFYQGNQSTAYFV